MPEKKKPSVIKTSKKDKKPVKPVLETHKKSDMKNFPWIGVMTVVILVGLGVYTWYYYAFEAKSKTPSSVTQQENNPTEKRITVADEALVQPSSDNVMVNGLVSEIMNLKNQIQQVQQNDQNWPIVEQSFNQIEQRLKVLEEKLEFGKQLEERMTRLENYVQQHKGSGLVFLTALSQLKEKIYTSRPFETELDVVLTIGRKDPEVIESLNQLSSFAKTGILTMEKLKESFNPSANQIALSYLNPKEDSWWTMAKKEIFSVVKIRRTEKRKEDPNSVDSLIGEASQALEEDQIQKAISFLEKLPENEKLQMQDWLDQAKAHQLSRDILSALTAKSLEKIAKQDL